MIKNLPASVEDAGSVLGLRRPPGEGNGNPLQYPCLQNPMDGRAWWATMHSVAKESDMTLWLNKNDALQSIFKSIHKWLNPHKQTSFCIFLSEQWKLYSPTPRERNIFFFLSWLRICRIISFLQCKFGTWLTHLLQVDDKPQSWEGMIGHCSEKVLFILSKHSQALTN